MRYIKGGKEARIGDVPTFFDVLAIRSVDPRAGGPEGERCLPIVVRGVEVVVDRDIARITGDKRLASVRDIRPHPALVVGAFGILGAQGAGQ